MIELTLSDATGSTTLQIPEIPLTEGTIEGATDVQTLDNNVSTYLSANKRIWSHKWAFMTPDDYDVVRGYYDRQWTNYKYPLFSIPHYGISNVPVRMTMDDKNIIDDCGTLGGVQATWRETRQMP